ncbi:anti-sigma factor [Cohnella sp. REN36]|uniref:anti-sigma factor family protein n=1 Tax=Cohnella sp. REN36 TaxID=2887347 RepID=UPI001D14F5FB|nr:zf-HC2 domain-containing protein [Cohnella sp. REN36]MCC3373625.1 zf-HC2 domain-containing protein [Cohnella sp. REN36]
MHPDDELSAYLDGELSRDERARIDAHLEDCSSCQSLLEQLMELKETFSSAMFAINEPDGFESRVAQAIARENRVRNLGMLWLVVPMLAAMLFGLLALAFGPLVLHLMQGVLAIGRALVYTISFAVVDMPLFSGVAVMISLIILIASILSLRRLLRSTAV